MDRKVLLYWSQGHDWNGGDAKLATRKEAVESLKDKLREEPDKLAAVLDRVPGDFEQLDVLQNDDGGYSWYLGWGDNPSEDLCEARDSNDLAVNVDGEEVYCG